MPPPAATQHHLDAALGWLELGNHVEAHNELEKLPYDHRATPDVLTLRCRIYRQAEKWDYLSMLSESCCKLSPDEPQFLADWAWGEYRQGRSEKAAAILLREYGRFPASATLAYDLAVMLGSLGRMAEAREWLSKAFERAREPDKLKLRALEQPELEKLWTEAQDR